ncbi:NAD(P)/FAD-dependent oxidoreductase [Streptomyces sp. SID8014]|uniref:phytoene desaturase family protein n=1 Tax=Streptomyces sp. SID8014 TaxID=2706097 RepID=UPI0013B9492A|nr:NAD(P)/FAD-dependent oxidoreductase [Streptomyces sp. SID8014]NEC16213.1 NAD(P)/FAD-dependent oxidoreductase [Streptomyces sp. SID8014]
MARIAVIGAGVGAMAAAARLAVAGHEVEVHERSDTYGGSLGQYRRDGFAFDTGPGLLTLPAVPRDLFLKTGRAALEDRVGLTETDPAVRHLFADGIRADLPHTSRAQVAAALDEALGGGAGQRWGAFLNRARDTWDRARRPLLEETLWPNWQVLADREPYPAEPWRRPLRRERRATTLAEIGAWELRDPRLAALLGHYALAAGLDPRTAPAGAAVLPYLEQTFGLWSVCGGLRSLAAALHERCLERKVRFVFGSEVTAIRTREGRAAGLVTADGTRVDADHVVAGVPPAVLDALLGAPVRAAGEVQAQREGGTTASRLLVLLALDGARPPGTVHRTVVHSRAPEAEAAHVFGGAPGVAADPTLTVDRPDDPGLVPDPAHEAVTVRLTVAPGTEPAEADLDRITARAEAAVPGLAGRLRWRHTVTPADIARATGAQGGAVPAPALPAGGGGLLHPANSTRVPGLFTVGGWSHPGGGLPHAGMSGALVAGLIVEGPEFTGST